MRATKFFPVFAFVGAAFMFAGCEGRVKVESEPTLPSVEQVESSPTTVPTPAVDLKKVEEIKAAWKVASATPVYGTQYSGWEEAVQKSYRFEKPACEAYLQWRDANFIFNLVQNDVASLKEAGISASALSEVHQRAGKYYAQVLLQAALDKEPLRCLLTAEQNTNVFVGYVENAIRVLAEAKLKPGDIGATTEKLRALHLRCAQHAMPALRKELERGTEGDHTASYEIERLMEGWHYTPEELGLTKEDLKRIDELAKLNEGS